MRNMLLCMAHLLVVSDVRYLQNSASSGAKTSFSDHKWLYFQSCLLSFKDMEHWRQPKDAPWKAAYFTYQALNYLINIGGLIGGNHLAKTGTEPASSRFSWNRYSWNGPKMEPLLTPGSGILGSNAGFAAAGFLFRMSFLDMYEANFDKLQVIMDAIIHAQACLKSDK